MYYILGKTRNVVKGWEGTQIVYLHCTVGSVRKHIESCLGVSQFVVIGI